MGGDRDIQTEAAGPSSSATQISAPFFWLFFAVTGRRSQDSLTFLITIEQDVAYYIGGKGVVSTRSRICGA